MNVAEVKRVLIYRLGSLGDTVVALPALRVIARAYPDAQRILLTNIPVHAKAPAAAAILDGSGLVHGYIDYPIATRNALSLARVWWKIARLQPDVAIYLTVSRGQQAIERDRKFFRLCGIPEIIGLPVGDRSANRYDPTSDKWESEASRLLRAVQELGSADVDDPQLWDLGLSAAEEQRAKELVGQSSAPVIVCGPGTKMPAKDWGQENWRALLGRLGEVFPGYRLVLVGAKEDEPVADFSAAEWPGEVTNVCGKLTPRETAAVIRRSELFLGPDSGPMHLAAAYGVPCAIAFAARDLPGRWFPAGSMHRVVYHSVSCRNCGLETCTVNEKRCLTSITVDEMFAAAVEAWKNGREARSGQLARG